MGAEQNVVSAAAHAFLSKFHQPTSLLVAISGGSDSTALLLALAETSDTLKQEGCTIDIHAATVDHGLRPEAAAEAAAVAEFCAARSIPHATLRWTGEKPSAGLQSAARAARYDLLRDHARAIGADALVTGHTLTDQRETVAMRMARSDEAGKGLSGMADATLYRRDLWILRPFLSIERETLRQFLAARGTPWADDPSNDDERFERVRFRRDGLALAIEPERIAAAAADRSARAEKLAAFLDAHASIAERALFVLSDAVPPDDPALVLEAVVELAMLAGGLVHGPGRAQCEDMARFLADPAARRLTLARCLIEKREASVLLYREARDLPVMTLEPGASVIWDRRFLLRNDDDTPVVIGPAGPEMHPILPPLDAPAGIPASVAVRARATLPHIEARQKAAPIAVESLIARHDTFLPAFDITIADALARLVGRDRYFRPPL